MSESPQRSLSDLYRASSREEPPASLDRAILAEARKASRFPASIALGSWGAPLAAAAVVVVTVSLVIALRDDLGSGYVAEMTTLKAPQQPSASREESASDVLASKRTEPRTTLNQDQQYLRSDTKRQAQGDDGKQNETIAKPERDASAASLEDKSSKAGVPAPSINAELMERSASAPPSLPASPAPALEAREQAPSPPASAPPAAAAGALGKLAAPREDAIEQRRARSSAESDQAGPQAKPNVASNDVPRRLEAAVDERIGPHAWLDRIIKLRDEGRHAEARESLAAFKKRYPDHPLPDALRTY